MKDTNLGNANMLSIAISNRKQLLTLGILGLFLLGAVIYSNILHAPFVYDDRGTIVENETIKSLSESFVNISNNRYVGLLSFAFNYAIGGLNVLGYHLVNNLIHVINALLVYYFVILVFKTPKMVTSTLSKEFIAFSASFIFISHPLQTQAVTYITQRVTSMAAMFYLISVVCYLKARLSLKTEESLSKSEVLGQFIHNLKSPAFYILSFISAILAIRPRKSH